MIASIIMMSYGSGDSCVSGGSTSWNIFSFILLSFFILRERTSLLNLRYNVYHNRQIEYDEAREDNFLAAFLLKILC